MTKQMPTVEEFFDDLAQSAAYNRYLAYWYSMKPEDHRTFFLRFVFAFASVNTPWERNVMMFNALRHLDWQNNPALLYMRLVESGAGMYRGRAKNMWSFCTDYWRDPDWYAKQPGEAWVEYRRRLVEAIPGLGRTKVSFTLEMSYPATEVVCLDRHMVRLYKKNHECSQKEYERFEAHWVRTAKHAGVLPGIARMLYWDQNQGYKDSRYWSEVLEASYV